MNIDPEMPKRQAVGIARRRSPVLWRRRGAIHNIAGSCGERKKIFSGVRKAGDKRVNVAIAIRRSGCCPEGNSATAVWRQTFGADSDRADALILLRNAGKGP